MEVYNVLVISGFQLMGFKPSSLLKKYYHVKPAQFIYPDETVNACKILLYKI